MAKRRLYELAKERGLESGELLEALTSAGVEGKSALSTMDEGELDEILSANGAAQQAGKSTSQDSAAAATNGLGPSAATQPLGLGERIRLMRRRRRLRKIHRAQLEELAELAIELYRLDSPRKEELADERLRVAAETDSELLQIEKRLGSTDMGGECPKCGLHSRRTRYCLRCGERLPTPHSQALSFTGGAVAVIVISLAWLLGGLNLGGQSTENASAPTGSRVAANRQAAGPQFRSIVAKVKGKQIGVYNSPTDPKPFTRLSSPNDDGARVVFLVKGKEIRGDWAHVYLPIRPNGSTGWIRLSKVTLSGHNFHLKINLTTHRLTAWNGDQRILKTPVGVGRAVTPTPPGLYYITELLQPTDPNGTYGPYAFGLSAHSNVLHEFAGGDGVLGLHGTNYPQGIGTNVSHGCIRLSNDAITKLAHTLPVGTPVRIVGHVA